jgi:hypothetical protein
MRDLRSRVAGRFTLCTDGLPAYATRDRVVKEVFGDTIDYASETKLFYIEPRTPYRRLMIRRRAWDNLVSVKRKAHIGNPDLSRTTTCHAERTNLSVRLFNRRFTRCTLGFSKTLANLRHAVALFVWHFNFVRVHSAHGQTPAMAANLTDRPLTIAELFSEPF